MRHFDLEEEEGLNAAVRREPLEESASQAFIKGYEKFTTVDDLYDYAQAQDELYSRSGGMTLEEFDTEITKLDNKFLAGRSDASLREFVPKALQIQEKVRAKIINDQRVHVENKMIQSIGKEVELLGKDLLESGIKSTEIASQMRTRLTDLQNDAKKMGATLDRGDIAEAFTNASGRLAASTGKPELLSWAFEPDKDGFIAAHHPNLQETVDRYLSQAESTETALETKRIEALKESIKRATENVERTIVLALGTNDLSTAISEINKHQNVLSSEKLDSYIREVNVLSQNANWSNDIDTEEYAVFRELAHQGDLTQEHRLEMRKYMPKAKGLQLIDINTTAKSSATTNTGSLMKQRVQDTMKGLFSYHRGPISAAGDPLDPNAGPRLRAIRHRWWELFEEIGGDYDKITGEMLRQWEKECDEVGKRYKPLVSFTDLGSSGGVGSGKASPTTIDIGAKLNEMIQTK